MFLLLLLLLPFSAMAGPPIAPLCAALPGEDTLEQRWPEFEALWQSHLREGVLESPVQPEEQPGEYRLQTGVRIAYGVLAQPGDATPRAAVVIANGRTESYLKYRELALTLWCRGYAVYMPDHRGQGLSTRVLAYRDGVTRRREDETPGQYVNRGHVEDFDNHVGDLEHFVHQVVPANVPRLLLAHSMGGAIGLRLLQKQPALFVAAALSSPMLGVPVQFACGGLAAWGEQRGRDAYVPGSGPWADEERYPYREDLAFLLRVGWHYTGSPVRHDLWHREFALPRRAPDGRIEDLRIGGPTLGWFAAACDIVDKLQSDAARVRIPVLVLIAADDTVIPEGRQRALCAAIAANAAPPGGCRAVRIDEARHEMFIERDQARDRLLSEVFAFFERQLPPVENVSDECQAGQTTDEKIRCSQPQTQM